MLEDEQGPSQRSTDGCHSANQMMSHHLPSVDRICLFMRDNQLEFCLNKTPIGGNIPEFNAKSNLCNRSKQRNW
jgi:hypothetical protein